MSLRCCSLTLPCLAQASHEMGIAHVLDLPIVEQWLAHDLLIRQILHCHQSVRMQLTEDVNIGCHPRWRINEAGAEAGEGQVSAKLPDGLLLWRCAEDLPCCERHGEPAVEEGLPGYVLRLQQAADDLGLESCQLGSDVHKGNATLVNCSAGDVSAGGRDVLPLPPQAGWPPRRCTPLCRAA